MAGSLISSQEPQTTRRATTLWHSQSDEANLASESESEDEFDQKLAKARQAGTTAVRKKKKADKQQGQQQAATTAKKLTKLEKFQQKKSGYEMSITAIKRTLAVQVEEAMTEPPPKPSPPADTPHPAGSLPAACRPMPSPPGRPRRHQPFATAAPTLFLPGCTNLTYFLLAVGPGQR